MESFDEAEFGTAGADDTTARERHVDFYALVMSDRVCVAPGTGEPAQPPNYGVTIVRLDMPVEMAKMVTQKRVIVQGPLSRNIGAEGDPVVAMKVTGLAGAGE
jgi:hypothetical protein